MLLNGFVLWFLTTNINNTRISKGENTMSVTFPWLALINLFCSYAKFEVRRYSRPLRMSSLVFKLEFDHDLKFRSMNGIIPLFWAGKIPGSVAVFSRIFRVLLEFFDLHFDARRPLVDWLIYNGPFCSCVLSCLAFEWKWGWRWPCFDRNLTAFLM